MVLVDSSSWIRGLAKQEPYAQELDRLLAKEQVAAHEMVYGELLIGDRGGRTQFLSVYERIYRAKTVPHRDVVQFVRDRKLHGRGVGWIDIHLLASAIVERLQLWTLDPRLNIVAKEFGVGYEAPGLAGGAS